MSRIESEARDLLLRRRRSLSDPAPALSGDPAARWTDYDASHSPIDAVRRELADIDAALLRIDEGRYGACLSCGGPMGLQRLRAIPEARYCVACSGQAQLEWPKIRDGDWVVGGFDLKLARNPDAETYARQCPSRYGPLAYPAVPSFIRSCVGVIPDVAASAVALLGLSEAACREAAERLGARFRWRPYDRLGRIEGA